MYRIETANQQAGQPLEEVRFEVKHRLEKPEDTVKVYFDAIAPNWNDAELEQKWNRDFVEDVRTGKQSIKPFLHSEERPTTLIITGEAKKGGIRMRIIEENQ